MATDNTYRIKLGSQIASSSLSESTQQLLSLKVELTMDGVGGSCEIELAGGNNTATAAKPGDEVTVDLDSGNGKVRVFTGEVEMTQAAATTQRVIANDSLVKLTNLEVEAAFEDVNVDFIVKQLLSEAKITAGKIDKGPKLASYILHRGPRAFRHIQHLAELCGADFYSDGEGAAHFVSPQKSGADHNFTYGENVMALDLYTLPPVFDSVEVWGEGAASTKGADKFHWLATDISGVSAKAMLSDDYQLQSGKTGKRPRQINCGALRSGEAAQQVADGQITSLATRRIKGYLKVFASPSVEPGDHIKITDLPQEHAAAEALRADSVLRVRRVIHEMDRRRGFVTRMDF